ncbi:MAG: hypothetical protein Q9227_005967 [Pyrenula ochraceoflavens]
MTLFLTSFTTLFNLTISNGTLSTNTPPLAPVLTQEPSSTVKHINWLWPSCLVGDGSSSTAKSSSTTAGPSSPSSSTIVNARGPYNISIHQSFRLNNTDYYTVFDLPIQVTNRIPAQPQPIGDKPAPGPANPDGTRLSCDQLGNPVVWPNQTANATHYPPKLPFIDGPVMVGSSSSSSTNNNGNGDKGSGQVSTTGSVFGAVTVTVTQPAGAKSSTGDKGGEDGQQGIDSGSNEGGLGGAGGIRVPGVGVLMVVGLGIVGLVAGML